MADIYQSNLSVKLPFKGNPGDTIFADLSDNVISPSRYGEPQIVAGVSKWSSYNSSIYFDGSGDGLYMTSATAWAFQALNFTIEGWMQPSPDAGANRCIFSTIRNDGNTSSPGAGSAFSGMGGFGGAGDESYSSGVGSLTPGTSGSLGQGGAGAAAGSVSSYGGGGGGGGGGGYWGGGGGSGGGGWWGGNGGSGGGGSNYVSETLSNAIRLNGASSFLAPNGSSETGHSGNGHVRITRVSNSNITNFTYTGAAQTFNVPSDDVYKIEVWGAQGTGNIQPGGKGGYASGEIALTTGQVLNVYVGGTNGYNGGGAGGASGSFAGGAGGGASDVRLTGTTLANRIIVAGGGGGWGGAGANNYGGNGGTIGGHAEQHGNNAGGPAGIGIFFDNTTKTFWATVSFTDGFRANLCDKALPIEDTTVFNHFALVREGNLLKLYRNGVKTDQVDVGNRIVYSNTANLAYVGCYRDDEGSKVYGMRSSFKGYMNDFRITKGVARYTTDTFSTPYPFYAQYVLSGVIIGPENTPVQRIVRLHSRDTGAMFSQTTSDPVTGEYTLIASEPGECYVVALDDSAEPTYNDLIIRAIPVEML